MKTVRVRYHFESNGWWADSEDLAGWTAAGATFEEVREQARGGVAAFAGEGAMIIEEGVPVATFAGIWRPLNATVEPAIRAWTTGASNLPQSSPGAGLVPQPSRTGESIGAGQAIPDAALAKFAKTA